MTKEDQLFAGQMRTAGLALGLTAGLFVPNLARAQSVEDLRSLSIEQLSDIKVSSVSKSAESLSDAPAAIYVISHDDVIRSGARTIPEMLRLAPNLEVAQLNATSYAISARGFNVGINAALSNKLLVLVDGRTVYSPLFGGVYWDMVQVLPENIDHIEVISGPGATLWGANAVNGVINIVTRKSSDTTGGLLSVGAGNLERSASLQYGGKIADDLTYRVHASGSDFSSFQDSSGHDAHDGWSKPQLGFRLDWSPIQDKVSFQGDIYGASEDPNGWVSGRDLVASWQHRFEGGSSLQVQAFWDKEARYLDDGAGGFFINTFDFDAQHSFQIGSWNEVVWGVGERAIRYQIENTALQLQPSARTLNLANIFGQDTISLPYAVKLTLGLKLESEPYTGLEPMPSARLSWKAMDQVLLWTAVSRADRSATPVDRDLREFSGGLDLLNGSDMFRPEDVTAYEIGTRVQATRDLSFSISGFYDDYDDLRTIEFSPGGFPLVWGNLMDGHVYGIEAWGTWRVTDWWQLSAGLEVQHETLDFKPGSSQIGGLAFVSDDPNHWAQIRSSMNVMSNVTWDATLRYVGVLPHPYLPDYAELNTKVAWQINDRVGISVAGYNLIHDRHAEFIEDGVTDQIPRSFFVETQVRF